jgi:hypothetical protein
MISPIVCLQVLKKLIEAPECVFFVEPSDYQAIADYTKYIARPMALKTVRHRLSMSHNKYTKVIGALKPLMRTAVCFWDARVCVSL